MCQRSAPTDRARPSASTRSRSGTGMVVRTPWGKGGRIDGRKGDEISAAWPPTGQLIVVTGDALGDPRAYSNQLIVVDAATGSATVLFEGERRTILDVIGFSPQGDRVLFARSDSDRNGDEAVGS